MLGKAPTPFGVCRYRGLPGGGEGFGGVRGDPPALRPTYLVGPESLTGENGGPRGSPGFGGAGGGFGGAVLSR